MNACRHSCTLCDCLDMQTNTPSIPYAYHTIMYNILSSIYVHACKLYKCMHANYIHACIHILYSQQFMVAVERDIIVSVACMHCMNKTP